MNMMNAIDEARARRELLSPALAKAIREAAGISQSAIARTLSVNRMTVCRWEAGRSRPNGHHLTAYADVLKALAAGTGSQR